MDFWPSMDWSLSYLADYSIPRLFSVGAGVQWWDLFSVGVSNSQPQVGIDPTSPDSTLTGGRRLSFAGTKIMARFSFDAKGLFSAEGPLVSMLGKEDLKLYGEMAILGLKNYPDTIADPVRNHGYEDVRERLPVMLGIYLPAFKMLDALNFELEYQDSPYPNSFHYVFYKLLPLPAERLPHSKVKWSLYAKKNIGPRCSVICQAARDHLLPYTAPAGNMFADKTDVVLRDTDWWWTVKMRFGF
jgi:hypothetical protein